MQILVPHKRVVEIEEGEEPQIARSFGVGTMCDIAQIEGEPLPEPPAAQDIREATDAGATHYRALETYAMRHGTIVVREELARGNGYDAPERNQIALGTQLTGDQLTKTMTHETAHVVADHRGWMPREDAETVAESTADVVLAHYGIDASGYTFPYVARWAEDRAVLTRNLAAIQQTSHAIISGIDSIETIEAIEAIEMNARPTPTPHHDQTDAGGGEGS